MKKWMLALVIALLVAGNVHAGSLQDRLAGLLGIEPTVEEKAERMLAKADIVDEPQLTFWLLGTPTELDNPDAEISGRVGWLADDLELGAQFDAIGVHGENDETFGIYAIMHIASRGILDTTYVGYAASIIDENRSYGPIAGTIIDNIVVEYRYRDFSGESPLGNADDRHQVYAGIVLRF